MATLQRILCATDFSPSAEPAWTFAQRLALAAKAELVVLHVVPWLPVPMEGAFDAKTYQRLAEEDLAAAQDRLAALAREVDPRIRAVARVEDGPAAARILAAAERDQVDLVVVGTHGRSGLNRVLVGSVAEQVVQLSPRPVVTVRPVAAPGTAPTRPVTRIVYPTDFSPAARRAWPWARRLAEATGAHVDILHILLEVVPDRHVDPAFLARAAEAIRAEAQKSADQFLAGCGLPADRVSVHLAHGVESEQIVHWAQGRQADLLVMGTHGRTGILRLALGSVARRVLHTAPCPMLTVGPEVKEA
jgi:nucleotide-binding universal stress UspA family protein